MGAMHVHDNPQYPPTIIYGSEIPDLRLRSSGGGQPTYFCRRNRNLHLTDRDFDGQGTYQAGSLLRSFCEEYCAPERGDTPCPAFVRSHNVFTKDETLASVTLQAPLQLELCLGVQKLLDTTSWPEERFLLSAYLDGHTTDEVAWRNELVEAWNRHCGRVDGDWFPMRSRMFDRLMWATIRYPALIPQAWLNWLAATEDRHMRVLEENPSRVDFIGFYHGQRHIIEIDGPSHYADFNETHSQVLR